MREMQIYFTSSLIRFCLKSLRTPKVYDDMREDIDAYDTSDYPKEHPLHSVTNKKLLSKIKDECAGRFIE